MSYHYRLEALNELVSFKHGIAIYNVFFIFIALRKISQCLATLTTNDNYQARPLRSRYVWMKEEFLYHSLNFYFDSNAFYFDSTSSQNFYFKYSFWQQLMGT